jgi:acetate kinase
VTVAAGGGSSRLTVLCLNAGSSTMKAAAYVVGDGPGDEQQTWRWEGEHAGATGVLEALRADGLGPPDAVGHRVVHGGAAHEAPALVDAALVAELRALTPLAPLHIPAAIRGIEALAAAMPNVPQVVCFDTAFHRTLPEAAAHLPLPAELWEQGIRRYGFHGLSYEYVVDRLGAAMLGRAAIAHLGNGASMCAVDDGASVDTTMGFTPAGGIVMGTRPGDLDPGLLVYLLEQGHDAASLNELISRRSGLLGLSGTSADMRELLAARAGGDPRAELAVTVFCRTLRKQLGAYAALLGGLDTIVFSGGIGEHAPAVRAEVCTGLEFLGVSIDEVRNCAVGDADVTVISAAGSAVTVSVVLTDEDRMVARHTARLLRAETA